MANEVIRHSTGPIPIISKLYLNKKGQPYVLPPKTEYWQGEQGLDLNDLTTIVNGKRFRNPSNWGITGLSQAEWNFWAPRSAHFDAACNQNVPFSHEQRVSIRQIIANKQRLKSGGLTWFYDYATTINDILVEPPYNSAFSQASIVHTLLFNACMTKNPEYLQLAKQAGFALIAPIERGGLTNADYGLTWFEEAPLPSGLNHYILNAHIYSANVLFLLAEQTSDERFRRAAMAGVRSLEKVFLEFDAGNWVRYDLRPRYSRMYFEIFFDPQTIITKIEFKHRGGDTFTVCEQGCDVSFSHARNDNSYRFEVFLESLRYFNPFDSAIEYSIVYQGSPPRLYAPGFRPDIREFIEIVPERNETTGTEGKVEGSIGLRDVGWHTPEDDYASLHAFLVADLWKRVKNPLFFVSAVRWSNYLRVAMNERRWGVEAYKERPFQPIADPDADAALTACFAGRDPLAIDLYAAAEALPGCVEPQKLAAYFRRLGLKVAEESPNLRITDGGSALIVESR